MSTKITDATWQNEVQKGFTLVDFWAPWCGPCRMLGPVLEEIEEELHNEVKIAKLNIDENQLTASQFGIMSIPTMVLFKDGKAIEKLTGYHPKEILLDYLTTKIDGQ